MDSNPLNHKTNYYRGAEHSHSEWLRRFIIKHNSHTANRVPNWELPRLRMIVQILSEIERLDQHEIIDLFESFSESEFSDQKTTHEDVEAEMKRVESHDSSLLTEFRKKLQLTREVEFTVDDYE